MTHLSRRRWSALVLWLVTALGVPLSAFAPAEANNVRIAHTLFGVHDSSLLSHSHVHDGSVRLWDVGVQWRDIEKSPGVYDFARLDQLVTAAQAAHESVTMVLAMTPSFYAPATPTDPPGKLQHFTDFVSAVMHRYRSFHGKRGISSYQVWNEANISTFWTGSMTQMAKLSKIVHDVGNRVDPQATIVSPPMVTRLGYQLDWLKKFYGMKLGGTPVWKFYDALGFSLYPLPTYGGRPGGPEDSMRQLGQVRSRLRSDHVPASVPIWNTEVNYGLQTGSLGGTPATPISSAKQASYVARTYLLNAAARVKRVYWYRYDLGAFSSGATLANTLLSQPGSPSVVTPAGRAFALVQKWMHGSLVGSGSHAPCAKDRHGTYTCVVKDSSGTRRIYWNPNRKGRVRLASSARHAQTILGAVSKVKGGSRLTVNYRPVMVYH
ncbi:hypothetical protein [Nocardioides cynanchi]|uniref:hypothetical protein n=1 Tax=Nocardioides cynanchi TaxID=2558918 RepID=UPI0012467C51|nr:hypothetical protein [Nocardioides cynanchi]